MRPLRSTRKAVIDLCGELKLIHNEFPLGLLTPPTESLAPRKKYQRPSNYMDSSTLQPARIHYGWHMAAAPSSFWKLL